MPIRSLLSETSFNTDQTEMIVKAFDDAWAQVQIDEAEPAMVVSQVWTSPNSSWNREPGDDSDDQGKGSDHDDRPQRDPDCEWHAPISLHVRSDQTR
jgi:hypothetical protein